MVILIKKSIVLDGGKDGRTDGQMDRYKSFFKVCLQVSKLKGRMIGVSFILAPHSGVVLKVTEHFLNNLNLESAQFNKKVAE